WVNGKAVTTQAGQWPLVLREGVNVIAMTAAADGKNPGLRLRIPGQSELESRWRVGAAANDNWLTAAFDDRSWKKAEADKDGYLSVPEDAASNVCFRQIVLWGETHYSGLTCLLPKVREWGFSEKSMENLFHVLYSPLSFPLEEYEFVLDVPKDFSLLKVSYVNDAKGGNLNRRPQKITEEEIQHDNQPYRRYRFGYESAFVPPGKQPNNMSLIPLLLNEFKGEDKTCNFYFHRMASGNLTEIEQKLPVLVLPTINGRMLKNVAIMQYSAPWQLANGGGLFPEHLNIVMRQSLDAGFNCWNIGAWQGERGRLVHDRVVERGGTVEISYNDYPIHGNVLGEASELGKWMATKPESRVRVFNEIRNKSTSPGGYCPSYVTSEGEELFRKAVKNDIALMKNGGTKQFIGFPKASIYWVDWETKPWVGNRSYCFCDRCKRGFRQYARLSETADLSDDLIFKNYKSEWASFRVILDARINGIVRDVCHELGLKYMFYDDAEHREALAANKGKIDIANTGCPGDGRGDSGQQGWMDRVMTFFRSEVGMSAIVGQLFATSYAEGGKINLNLSSPWEKDGFLNPKKVKMYILRVVATFHGGVDLHSAVERCSGSHYYVGEATRIISEYEDLFFAGERADQLAVSEQIKYP
ncbi:MAG: hypothetical protein WCI51_23300, partial [Lentisphaerota bacterium]